MRNSASSEPLRKHGVMYTTATASFALPNLDTTNGTKKKIIPKSDLWQHDIVKVILMVSSAFTNSGIFCSNNRELYTYLNLRVMKIYNCGDEIITIYYRNIIGWNERKYLTILVVLF